jgi:membrane fusion protein, multidrug efflux system
MKTQIITGGMFVVLASLSACTGKSEPTEQAVSATPVHVTLPTAGPAAPPIVTTGIITAADEIKLSFKAGGVIERIRVREGERVAAGQTLAELMPAEINAGVTQAQQLYDKAQRDLERGQRLYNDQVISLEQFQNLQTQTKVAAAQLDAARFNQKWVNITAPSSGVVMRKLADDHEAVAPGQPVLVLGAAQRGYIVKAALADRELVQLKRGDAVNVTVDALPDATLKGTVTVIGGAASADNGLFPVEVTLDQSDATLVAGMVAHLSFAPSKSKDTLLYIPAGAVVSGVNNQADVFVLQGEMAKQRGVQVAFFTRDQVALQSGLQAGEQVITDGALYLSDGERVSVQQ